MPRHAKSTKIERDKSMIAGLKKRARELSSIEAFPFLQSVDTVVARLQAHLTSLAAVQTQRIQWLVAVREERRLEAETKTLLVRVKPFLMSVYGEGSATLLEFGLKPLKKPKISVETKRIAVEKRRETRKLRGTMGKKQRRALKGR